MINVIIFSDSALRNKLGTHPRLSLRSVGPYRLATEIRKRNLSCQVIEMMTEFTLEELEQLCQRLISTSTLVVGFSTNFWMASSPTVSAKITKIIYTSRKLNPKLKIVTGGANALGFSEKYDVDAGFLGYSEHTFIKYLEHLTSVSPQLVPSRFLGKTKIYDFVEHSDVFNFCNSKIEYSSTDFLLPGEPVILEVGRGCIFRCKFCSYPLIGKKKLDHLKDPEIIKEEILKNYEDYKIDKYVISDDTFNDSNEKLEFLHGIFTSLPFDIKFSSYLRLDLLNKHRHQIELLYDMGLVGANFGVESFHEKAARVVGKGIVSGIAKDFLYDLKTKYWGNRVKIQVNLIAGLPHETYESYEETNNWILNEETCLVDSISVSALGLSNPKAVNKSWVSEFEENSEKYGYYWKDTDPRVWYNDTSPVKNSNEASKIMKRLMLSAQDAQRRLQGGFFMFSTFGKSMFFENQKTFEEQILMNRKDYTKWFLSQTVNGTKKFILDYKHKILNL